MLKPDEYVKNAYDKLYEYVDGIKDGSIISNVWVKSAVTRWERDIEGEIYEFNSEAFERVIKFFSITNILDKRDNIWKQFPLIPFQIFTLANLFGLYYRGTTTRKYNYCFLYIPRKNGKSPLSVVITLYMLVMDGQQSGQIMLLANTSEQAHVDYRYIEGILTNSPLLAKLVKKYSHQFIYETKSSKSFITVKSHNPQALDGYSPTSAILDEIHAYPDNLVFSKVKSGIISTKNPMIMLISSAGSKIDSFCYSMLEMGKQVLSGDLEDESFFFLLYQPNVGDSIHDETTWYRANPSMNIIIPIERFRIEYKQALNMPSLMKEFLALDLNIYSEEIGGWIAREELKKCEYEFKEEDFLGCDCYVGLDLSSNRDLTAISLIFDKNDGDFYSKTYFFRANNDDTLIRKNGFNLNQWIDKGYIKQMDTKTIDFDYLYDFLIQITNKYNVISIGYDPFSAPLLIPRLEAYGFKYCQAIPQNYTHSNQPLKYMETLILEYKLKIDKNPCMFWNFSNVCLNKDRSFNIMIGKDKSKDSVDGVLALQMALHEWVRINMMPEYLDMKNINMDVFTK